MTTETPRRATRADLPACARIIHDWEQATGWMPSDQTPPVEVLAGYIDAAFDAREIWVIGDPVAGYASIDPETSKLGAIYIAAPGRGFGKLLMDRAKQGRDHLWLTTHAPNTRAQAFYRREGFVKTADLPGEPPHEAIPLHRMEWHA